ncbi:MAG: hypothetical protein [Microvirus sp.]|nr:MAG: hypothetical protein [Microvirus sp.]
MKWDWQSLLQTVLPAIFTWLLGALGVGVPKVTPERKFNINN